MLSGHDTVSRLLVIRVIKEEGRTSVSSEYRAAIQGDPREIGSVPEGLSAPFTNKEPNYEVAMGRYGPRARAYLPRRFQ